MGPQSLLSTRDVAVLFKVGESTVKRWADEGVLACAKTPGGHRKFLTKDILAFAERHQYPMTGALPPPSGQGEGTALQRGVQSQNFPLLASLFLEEVMLADRTGLYEFVAYLSKHRIPFAQLADDIIRPAMQGIGDRWQADRLRVDQEHLASQVVLETLLRSGPEFYRKSSNELTAVCTCLEGEFHDIGLQCVAYALEIEGWSVRMLGADVPTESTRILIKNLRPNLVCLSSTVNRGRATRDAIRSLAITVHSQKGVLIVGGDHGMHIAEAERGADFAAESIDKAMKYVRDRFQLKPGPKTRNADTGEKTIRRGKRRAAAGR